MTRIVTSLRRLAAGAALAGALAVVLVVAARGASVPETSASAGSQDVVGTPPDIVPPDEADAGDLVDLDTFGDAAELSAADDAEDVKILEELELYGALDEDDDLALFEESANADLLDDMLSMDEADIPGIFDLPDALPDEDGDGQDLATLVAEAAGPALSRAGVFDAQSCRSKMRAIRRKARAEVQAARRKLLEEVRAKRRACQIQTQDASFPANHVNPADACLDQHRAASVTYRHAVESVRDEQQKAYRAARLSCQPACGDGNGCRKARRAALRSCRAASRIGTDAYERVRLRAMVICREEGAGGDACRRVQRAVHVEYRKAARVARSNCRKAVRAASRGCRQAVRAAAG